MQEKKQNDQFKTLSNLFFNIILPTIILHKMSKYFGERGPFIALIVALMFPLTYGIHDYIQSKKNNLIAIIGIISILLTGGLALLKLHGFWFAVKEASIPLIIGIAVVISAFTKKPFIHFLIFNETLMKVDLIKEKLEEKNSDKKFHQLLRITTILLGMSFFMSSFLNYYLARQIFTEISLSLTDHQKSMMINDQIAQMSWKGYIVIALPGLVVTSTIILYLAHGIKKLTGLDFQEVFKA